MVFGCTLNKHPWNINISSRKIYPPFYLCREADMSLSDNVCLDQVVNAHSPFSVMLVN